MDEVVNNNKEILSGGVPEIKEMIQKFNDRESCAIKINQASDLGKKLEKDLQQERDKTEEDVKKTLLQEQNKFTIEEDTKLNKKNKELKDVQIKRNKAKDKGVRNRIQAETSDLVEENKSLHRVVRKTLKENGLPTYCDSNWFYVMYNPIGLKEWLIRILVFFTGIFLLPYLVLKITDPFWFFKFLLWIFMDVIFLAIYITIYLLSKDKDAGTLEEMREHRDKINENAKKIRLIKKDIKNDGDETGYNLQKFDSEIESLNKEICELTKIRDSKVAQFNDEKKQSVEDQVREQHQFTIENLQKKIEQQLEVCNDLKNQLNNIDQNISDSYEKEFTKQYTTKDVALRIMDLLENGSVSTIGEGFEIVKK